MPLTGYAKACGKNPSGIYRIGVMEAADFTGATLDPMDSTYSAVTVKNGATFAKYEFDQDQAEYQENVSNENDALSVAQNILFRLGNMDNKTREAVDELMAAHYCGMIAVVQRVKNGPAWIIGYDEAYGKDRPLRFGSTEATTGRALSDEKGENVTLSRTSTEKARLFTGDVDALFGDVNP